MKCLIKPNQWKLQISDNLQSFRKPRRQGRQITFKKNCQQEVDLTIEIIAYCGLDCSQCPSYQATKKNDIAALKSIAKKWPPNLAEITVNDVVCEGCFGPRVSKCCLEYCAIRRCAIGKTVKNCAYCNEYKCQNLAELMKKIPTIAEKLDAIHRSFQSHGLTFT